MGLETHNTAELSKFQRPRRTRRRALPSIRQRRHALGLLQKQLAYEAGVSTCALSCAERDARYHYGTEALRKIEGALHRLEVYRNATAIVDEAWL